MPAATTTSPIETEMMRATKLRQKEHETRSDYLGRMLEAGQNLPPPIWNTLSPEAQAWYNDGINAYNMHSDFADIPDFASATPPPVQRATMQQRKAAEPVPEPEPEEPEAEPEPEATSTEDEWEEPGGDPTEDEWVEPEEPEAEAEPEPEPEEPPKRQATRKPKPASKPVPKPAAKPTPKPASKPSRKSAAEPKETVSRPPKPGAPGATTMIKRMLIKDINVTNAELMEKLNEQGVSVTAITVSTLRSDFRHSLRVLQEAGYCLDLAAKIK